jgi:hypothetical protein
MTWVRAALVTLVVAALVVAGLTAYRILDDPSRVEQGLEALPEETLVANFTDWSAVRSELSLDLDASSSAVDLDEFFDAAYDRDFSAASVLALDHEAIQDAYGWGVVDSEWEMYGQSPDGAVEVLRMTEGFDFDAADAALTTLGYPAADGDGIRVGGTDLVAAIAAGLTPQLANIALLPDDGLIVSSDNTAYLAGALDARDGGKTMADVDRSQQLASALPDDATTTILTAGGRACVTSGFGDADAETKRLARQRIDAAGGVHPLDGLALSLTSNSDLVVAMAFEDEAAAESDLAARRELATGDAPAQGGTFEDRFDVASATQDGSTIVMRLHPKSDDYQLLSDLGRGGLLFASC